jgi:hypothetical protein
MKKHKIKFGTASNGQEALDKWNGGGYHLILVSRRMCARTTFGIGNFSFSKYTKQFFLMS